MQLGVSVVTLIHQAIPRCSSALSRRNSRFSNVVYTIAFTEIELLRPIVLGGDRLFVYNEHEVLRRGYYAQSLSWNESLS